MLTASACLRSIPYPLARGEHERQRRPCLLNRAFLSCIHRHLPPLLVLLVLVLVLLVLVLLVLVLLLLLLLLGLLLPPFTGGRVLHAFWAVRKVVTVSTTAVRRLLPVPRIEASGTF